MRLVCLVFLPAAIYQLLALFAALQHLFKRRSSHPHSNPPRGTSSPGVSVLKPLRGIDPNTHQAFVSQIEQRYPSFEILFGAREGNDPATLEVRRLQAEFPNAPLDLIIGSAPARNGKVGVLIELARHARNPIWVVNDSDIKVDPEYLSAVAAPLADPAIGVVTCLYRATAHSAASTFEALGIATDFMPSALVASLLGVREFGLGATLAFRAADLEAAGGFAAIADYLADDYQLAKRITARGKRAILSSYVVETALGDSTWAGVSSHQLRWARTIRASKGAAWGGLPIAQAGLWIAIALFCGAWPCALVLAALRIASAALTGWFILRSSIAGAFFWLAPIWDMYSFCIWLASYAGREVRWRDQTLRIDPQGRILE